MSNLRRQSIEFWKSSSNTIQDHFGLDTSHELKQVQIIDSFHALRFGGQYLVDRELLQITQEVIDNKIPLQGVIHRECLFHSLPVDICYEARYDVASCYAREFLGKIDKTHWIENWKLLPERRVRPNLLYNSFEMIDWMYKLGGYEELVTLIHEFESMSRYGKSLEFEEYMEYMIRRTQDIVIGLSQTEIKIIDALEKEADVSYRNISKSTGLSESWISTRINHLKNIYVLADLTAAPFSRIGIRTFHVLLAGPAGDEPTRFIKNCPFLYNVRPILNGPWQVIGRLAVPDNRTNINAINKMVSLLQRDGIAIDVSETYSVGITNSFYHYNTKTKQWDIPWVAMESWGHRIQSESLHYLVDRIDYPAKTTDQYLDSTDFEILELVHQGISSTRALREKLSIGQTKLIDRVQKLRAEELIRKTWAVYNIGLIERVALRVTDKETASMVDTWSRELPRGYLRYEENRHLMMMAELPVGASSKLMDVLRKLRWPVSISAIGSGVWGDWEFPKSQWNVDKQRWDAPNSEINSWLNDVAIECDKSDNVELDSYRHFLKTQ